MLFSHFAFICSDALRPPGPPIITADGTQHAVKHSKGKLECRVGSSPPPDKIVSELLISVSSPVFYLSLALLFLYLSLVTPCPTHMRWITQRGFIPDLTFTPLHRHSCTSHANEPTPTHTHTHIFTSVTAREVAGCRDSRVGSSGGRPISCRSQQKNCVQLAAREASPALTPLNRGAGAGRKRG